MVPEGIEGDRDGYVKHTHAGAVRVGELPLLCNDPRKVTWARLPCTCYFVCLCAVGLRSLKRSRWSRGDCDFKLTSLVLLLRF